MRINNILRILADFIKDYGPGSVSLVEGSAVLSFPELEPMLRRYGSQYGYTAMPLMRVVFSVPAMVDLSGKAYSGEITVDAVEIETGRIMITMGDGSGGIVVLDPAAVDRLVFRPGGNEQKNMGNVKKFLDDIDETGL
ncbi:MAG: hypothetical protein AMDU1_APLC00029G0056 [Thermoplasmatales archaeon A-plasma]|jgi:hypothetical protein|nr:MAG: hypothetical protein AMDU1_APLC00029G0056 [Thermoplasmatales archaeon A-plasma]WMT43837.1 MAG: hypothetical protein RE469_06420 [Cuniculiplasma divulgatum]